MYCSAVNFEICVGIGPLNSLLLSSLCSNRFDYMLRNGAMFHVILVFYPNKGLKKRDNSRIHAEKAHRSRKLTKADTSEGMLPESLLSVREL